MKTLFKIKLLSSKEKLVVADSMERVVVVYSPTSIEVVDTVVIIHDKEQHWIDVSELAIHINKSDERSFQLSHPDEQTDNESENIHHYINRLQGMVIDAKCSARGNQSTFEANAELIKKLKWTLENALATEEKHYESDETIPGWIAEAKELL